MSPQVVAAITAASVGVLTLIGTLAAQYFGRLATSRDTQRALEEQSKQLDRTLAEQRTRTLNERYDMAASQLGSDKPPTVRLAGVYAMAGLADEWEANQQTCINVLCGYLRMPYEPDPGEEAPEAARLAFRASREVRHTLIRVITAHLKVGTGSWRGLDFDFTGVVFDGGDFGGAEFSGGQVSFDRAKFSGGTVSFSGAEFSGGQVSFGRAEFADGEVQFDRTVFTGGHVSFEGAQFTGGTVYFDSAVFTAGQIGFDLALFGGGEVLFSRAGFSGGNVHFTRSEFADGAVSFDNARFSGGHVNYFIAHFCGAQVSFHDAEFSSGEVDFSAKFADGDVSFDNAGFSGAQVSFQDAEFSGGEVDFSHALDWSVPPAFGWPADSPPQGVWLPGKQNQPRP